MDVSGIFGNNIIIVYFFICIGLFIHSEMSENQKMVILYLCSYVACLLRVFPVIPMTVVVVAIQFIYSEYLTDDIMKLKVVTKFAYKVLDYAFSFVFNYATWLFICALVLISYRVEQLFGENYLFPWIASGVVMFFLIQNIISRKFRAKSINQIMKVFEQYPIYQLPDDIAQEKFEILSDMEDKSYFARENTYNVLSFEFLRYKFRSITKKQISRLHVRTKIKLFWKYLKRSKNLRGYSTIEMQLIRNIGIEHGYNCVIRRKIYEFLYTKIFMTSLRTYFKEHQSGKWWDFKKYLIWIYYNTVSVNINGIEYRPFASAFGTTINNWTMEQMFIAVLSLSGRIVSDHNLNLYRWVIEKYDLNEGIIRYLSKQEDITFYEYFECSLYLPQMEVIDFNVANEAINLLNSEKGKEWEITYELYPQELQLKLSTKNLVRLSDVEEKIKSILEVNSNVQWQIAWG